MSNGTDGHGDDYYNYQQSSYWQQESSSLAAEEDEAEQELHVMSLYFVLFAAMLAVVLVSTKYLHESKRLSSYISEPALTLGIGTLVGGTIWILLPNFEPYSNSGGGGGDSSGGRVEEGEDDNNNVLAHSLLSFSPNVFFMALLPPILFNSGYQLRRELFYRHIKPILLFACLGTTICALVTAFLLYGLSRLGWLGGGDDDAFQPSLLELLTFGSLIAATDTVSVLGVFQAKKVDPHLFYLVFGESALNDAVAMILFATFSELLLEQQQGQQHHQGADYDDDHVVQDATGIALKVVSFLLGLAEQAILSPLLGILFAFGAALVFKQVDLRRHSAAELPLYMLLMYTPFVLAECVHLSGVVAIFFSGISARRYIAPNVSFETRHNANVLFQLSANLAETCIFLELGLSVFGLPGSSFNWSFIAWAFLGSLLGRALGIYPLVLVHNYCLTERSWPVEELPNAASDGDLRKLDGEVLATFQRSLSMDSLSHIRTPAKRQDKHVDEFTAATMSIVLVSIIFMGGTTGHLLQALGIATNVDEDAYMNEWRKQRALKGRFHELGTCPADQFHTQHTHKTDFSLFIVFPENKYIFSYVVRQVNPSSDVVVDDDSPNGSTEDGLSVSDQPTAAPSPPLSLGSATTTKHCDNECIMEKTSNHKWSSDPVPMPYDEAVSFRRMD
jgi:NhaP-type Na+/H+ or K+/H+ antiporter